MLTPTPGYIKHTEMYAPYVEQLTNEESVIGFGIVTRPQPDNSRTDDEYGYIQRCSVKYQDSAVPAGNTTRKNIIDLDASIDFEKISSLQETGWETDQNTENKSNAITHLPSNVGIDLRVDVNNARSFYTGSSPVLNTIRISALMLQKFPDTPITEFIESTGIKNSVSPSAFEWTPYDENESCSSFMMKAVAVNNPLVINHRTAEKRTYPVFRGSVRI